MRALRAPVGAIPRGYRDHRTQEGKLYTEYCRAQQAQNGPLPLVATPTLREAGRLSVDLVLLGRDLELARARKQRREVARILKRQFMAREQLARLERRLEELGAQRPPDRLAAVRLAVVEANR
jgi:hypothetical protein